MWKSGWFLLLAFAASVACGAEPAAAPAETSSGARRTDGKAVVYVIRIDGEIGQPTLYILRRGLKEAAEHHADAVVLDMDTLGGAADAALDMMEALDRFPGLTITFVDREAMSAGSFIAAATREIWFEPRGVIGAAAAVTSEGQDIPETMRLKMTSFLRAKVRSVSEGKGFRAQVIESMIDKDYELKIGDKVLKPKGELLSRTASEAMEKFGNPPQPLLGAGIATSVDDLLTQKFGEGHYVVTTLQVTWSEHLARYLTAIAPLLLGLGLLALFIEFKMPGHGWIGAIGVLLLGLVFLGHHVAGLSGHEPVLFFMLGLALFAVEVLFFPGVFILALGGIGVMLVSLLWAMADIWPGEPLPAATGELVQPLGSVGLGLAIAVVGGAILIRFLPRGWMWDRMVVGATVGLSAQAAGVSPEQVALLDSLIGKRAVAATALRPGGQIEVDGRRFEARTEVGAIDAGAPVLVRRRADFSLIVEPVAG
ncbi:MAG TPA: NfeD family protein [Candidatus Didemnitutus sp.]|nr:NfeD family protein [Candidatus Didemnitutus sp.]